MHFKAAGSCRHCVNGSKSGMKTSSYKNSHMKGILFEEGRFESEFAIHAGFCGQVHQLSSTEDYHFSLYGRLSNKL